ncbi:MAG TPA: succinate dehydrogenase cytochrome b subunit [Cyclobacteriaceae bacterium]|mgnify:CR=1 FL=1|nr:succinate dehydrogenase cytochrome b subunit [Cyclobacteriaceae bacterium]
MNWLTKHLSSTLGKKLLMALTGLFLIIFLIAHLVGNLQLVYDDGGKSFNLYAEFMTTNPLIKTVSYVLYASIVMHIIWSLQLTIKNRKARGTERYAVVNNASGWSSRNMGILGTLIFIFLVIHLRGFWYEMHWGGIPSVSYDGQEVKDLYSVVSAAYAQAWYVALYVISMVVVGFHLWHGFASAFQTLGLNHVKYNGFISALGKIYSIVVPAAFAYIPLYMFFN